MRRILVSINLLLLVIAVGSAWAGDIVASIGWDGKHVSIKKSALTGDLEVLLKNRIENKVDAEILKKDEIKKIAQEYGLYNIGGINWVLGIKDGDVSYWFENKVTKTDFQIHCLARKIVIDNANDQRVVIDDSGKLSYLAERLIQEINKKLFE